MIQSSFSENRSVFFRVLSDDQIWEIKRAAFDILEKTGAKVLHEGARKMLKQAGAVVKGEIVKVPEHIVQECLRTAPKGFTIYDREGQRAMEVEGRKSYYGTSTASPRTKDALTGEIHDTRVIDIARGAHVADALPNIDWVMPMGSVQDVPPTVADLYEFEAVVTNTTKPTVFIGYTPRGVELTFEMAAEVAGGIEGSVDSLHGLAAVAQVREPGSQGFFGRQRGQIGRRTTKGKDTPYHCHQENGPQRDPQPGAPRTRPGSGRSLGGWLGRRRRLPPARPWPG